MLEKLLITTLVLGFTASQALAQAAPDIKAGRRLARTYCGSCHATGATDRSRQPKAVAFRRLSERYPVEGLEEALAEGILVGHSDMPQLRFSERGVAQLIAYLQTLQPLRPRAER